MEPLELTSNPEIHAAPQPDAVADQPVAAVPLKVRKPQSQETREKRAAKLRGLKRSPEFCKASSERQKGKIISQEQREKIRKKLLGRKLSDEHRRKISLGNMGKKMSKECCEKHSKRLKGVKPSPQCLEAGRIAQIGRHQSPEEKRKRAEKLRGEKSHFWRGGKGKRQRTNDIEYRIWRGEVYKRDNWTCQARYRCAGKRRELFAHHIIPWSQDEEKRYWVENGITLCRECHAEFDEHFARFSGIKNSQPLNS